MNEGSGDPWEIVEDDVAGVAMNVFKHQPTLAAPDLGHVGGAR